MKPIVVSAFVMLLALASPLIAGDSYQTLRFAGVGSADIVQWSEGGQNHLAIAGVAAGGTVVYPPNMPPLSIKVIPGGIDVIAPAGWSISTGQCVPNEFNDCVSYPDGTSTCECSPGGNWCDTAIVDDDAPTLSLGLAGC